MERAIDECIRERILAKFLTRNRNEVISMSIFKYDKELEEKKLRQAEFEAGRETGFAEGETSGISKGKEIGFQSAASNCQTYAAIQEIFT